MRIQKFQQNGYFRPLKRTIWKSLNTYFIIKINTNKKSIHGTSPLFLVLKINNMRNYKEQEYQNKNNIKIISHLIKNNIDVNEILKNGVRY